MSWKHIAALGIAAVLLMLAGVIVFVCGLHPACAAAGAFAQVVTMSMAIVSVAGSIITGVFALIRSDGTSPKEPQRKD